MHLFNSNNNNNIIKNKNKNYKEININKKIIPLFSSPIELKQIKLRQKNIYKFNFINPSFPFGGKKGKEGGVFENKNLNNKVINLNEILSIFLRGVNLYNLTLNNYLKKENNNKLKLIRELKFDEYNKLNIIYNNYLYLLNRYLPLLRFRSLIYKLELFTPKRLLKYNYLYTYTYRLKSLHLNKKFEYLKLRKFINNKIKNINIRMINKILEKGLILSLEMNILINKKKTIINNFKLNNLFSSVNNFIIDIINKKSLLEELKLKKDKQNNYDKLLNLNNKKINLDLSFNQINKNNEIKIRNTRKSILNYSNFSSNEAFGPFGDKNLNNYSSPSLGPGPIEIMYNNNKPIINQYLKEMSKFNMLRKGIFIYYNNLIGFNFNNNTNKLIKNIYKLLQSSFKSMYCLISKPVFLFTPDKITIQLFYYLFIPNLLKLKQIKLLNNKKYNYFKLIKNLRDLKKKHRRFKKQISRFRRFKNNNKFNFINLSNYNLTKIYSNKFNILCNILSNLFKKPVELNLIRLHYPYLDSNILVNLLGIMINKIKLRILIRKLFENTIIKNLKTVNLNRNNNIIPAFLSGINIKVAGRLLTQRVVPRKTVKNIIRGASARSKVNYLDVARYSNKNRRGAFSITIKSGQNFF
jgi:Mitochondrial ribosomal protein (VAR1)